MLDRYEDGEKWRVGIGTRGGHSRFRSPNSGSLWSVGGIASGIKLFFSFFLSFQQV